MNARVLLRQLELDEQERLFVMLYYTEQLSIEEAAAVLGISRFRASAMQRSIANRTQALLDAENDVVRIPK